MKNGGPCPPYRADFIVEAKGDMFFAVEVKARNEITDKNVQAKARAGMIWCKP